MECDVSYLAVDSGRTCSEVLGEVQDFHAAAAKEFRAGSGFGREREAIFGDLKKL
jgi:hypothetical protein